MGNWLNKEPPPPVVLVPPLFDFPPLAARTRFSFNPTTYVSSLANSYKFYSRFLKSDFIILIDHTETTVVQDVRVFV